MDKIVKRLAAFWRPPDRRSIPEWAREYVEMPPAVTIRGRFDVSRSRHLLGPFDALGSDHVRETNILAPVRGGKSLVADVWIPWIVENDPGPLIWNFQKDQTADEHCETRLWPVLLGCAPVRKRLGALPRNHKRTSEIIFPHMFVIVQGPAISNLQSKGCRYLVNDELWQYPPGRLAEAYGRVDDFVKLGIEKILNMSQASEPDTEWHEKWEGSSRHAWWIECQKCHKPQYPAWSGQRSDGSRYGLRWDEHRLPRGDWHLTQCLPTIRWECAHCGHPHLDGARIKREWNRTGRYSQTNSDARPTRLGFHWNALIDYPWTELAERYLRAADARRKGVLLPMIQFFQKYMAQFMSEAKLLEQSMALPTVRYEVTSDWAEEHIRFFTVDRQAEDTYWGTIRAWSKTGESRRLWFGQLLGAAAIEQKRTELKVGARQTFVDSGHEAKGDFGVYAHCAQYGWVATKGSGYKSFVNRRMVNGRVLLVRAPYKDPTPVAPSVGAKKRCWLIVFSADEMKDRVRGLIRRGLWQEPAGDETELGAEYQRQMNSEFKRPKRDKFTGRTELKWVCPSGNNHAFDCAAGQALGATILDILPSSDTSLSPSHDAGVGHILSHA